MHKVFTFIAVIISLHLTAYAAGKVKINKTTQRRPSQESGDAYLANSSFLGFLNCSGSKTEAETLKCVKRYFTPETSESKILRYSEALYIAKEYSELFYCDDETKKKIEAFEEKDYDFYLCFQSSIVPSEQKIGTAYFKKSSGMPKINRLQM
ncbi:hypothetical protein D3C87_1145210 [compost metagenome]